MNSNAYTCFKWLKSENCSSKESKRLANKTREAFGMTHREYRKMLSWGRERLNVLEVLMSANRWEDIDFSKIPSRAGFIYRSAFARRDIIAKKYEAFAKSKETKVNADVLNPVDIAERILKSWDVSYIDDTQRAMYQKYWDNLKDYYNGREENGLAIVDVSGSMWDKPLAAAVSMGAYIAERGHGPFANHFITFSSFPELVKFQGIDIADKFIRCKNADWGLDTNIEAVFDLLLNTAKKAGTRAEDMPTRLYIFSDMEFNAGLGPRCESEGKVNTLLESIAAKWKSEGYELPQVIFWNLDARNDNIPAIGGRFAYVSGFSMNMVECILSGKDGVDLMLMKLNSERYAAVK